MRRVLNEKGLELEADFAAVADQGCSCHLNPPCGFCTHPGNPLNLLETPDAWEEVPDESA